jgi:hypothetical protein
MGMRIDAPMYQQGCCMDEEEQQLLSRRSPKVDPQKHLMK